MAKKLKYRVANPADIPDIFLLLIEMHKENGLAALDTTKTMMKIGELVKEGFVAVASNDDDEIVASVGAGVGQQWYSNDHHIGDYWMFVGKGYRRSMAAQKLIEMLRVFARGVKLPLYVAIVSKQDTKRKNALYRRRFKAIGESFMMEAR